MGLRAICVHGCCWALLGGASAAEAAEAAGWTAPATLPRGAYVDEMAVDVGDRGGVLAFPRGGTLIVARITTRGALGPVYRVPDSRDASEDVNAAVNPRGDAAVAWVFADVKPGEEDLLLPCCDRAAASTWRPGGSPSRAVALSTPDDYVRDLTLGVNGAGTTVVLWQLLTGGAIGGAAALRGAGFGPFELDPGQEDFGDIGVSLGFDRRDRAHAVFGDASGLRATLRGATGDAAGSFGRSRPLHLPRDALDNFETDVQTDGRGGQIAVWAGFTGVAKDTAQIAFRRPGGDFGRPRVLTRDTTAASVALGPAGHVVAAWLARRNGRTVVRVKRRRPSGRFGPPQTLAGTGSQPDLPAVGVDSRGRAVAIVSSATRRATAVRAFRAGPTRPFRAGQDIARAHRGSFCAQPSVDVSPRGRAFAWWECDLPNRDDVARYAAFRP